MHKIYGIHAVQALIKSKPKSIQTLWVQAGRDDARMQALIEEAKNACVACSFQAKEALEKEAPAKVHQGVLAWCNELPGALPEEVLWEMLPTFIPPFLLVLDGVQDPHNLGACLRTAEGAGVQAVIIPKNQAVDITPAVRKVASGAAESLPVIVVTNVARTLAKLKEHGVWLVGADSKATHTLYEQDLAGPLALVLGGEGKGLRRLTQEHCDFLVSIPMNGAVSSLNVSVATGVCLFEAVRQRHGAPNQPMFLP